MATHDLRFTAEFDTIIVLENGMLMGQGKHDELLVNCPLYKQLWNLDLSLSQTKMVDAPHNKKPRST